MKLFFSKGSCALATRIILNEIGVALDFESVDLKTKQTETKQNFLEINPKGYVPTLRLENGEILTENVVIMTYLADHYEAGNLLPALGDWQRYRVLEWLNYVSTELHKGFSPIFNPAIPQALKETVFIPKIMDRLAYVDHCLQNNRYLMGKHFTLPDAYLFTVLRWVVAKQLPIQSLEALLRYLEQVRTRKSVVDALSQEGLPQ